MTARSEVYLAAVVEVGGKVREVMANLVDQKKPLEGLIEDWEVLSHNGRLQQIVFLCYEIRVAYSAYVSCVMEACVSAGRADKADEFLAIYSRSGTGYLLPIKKFWRN